MVTSTPINGPADLPKTELGPVDSVALPAAPGGVFIPAKPVGRYTDSQVAFSEAVRAAELGDKYNLDDEIVAIRAQLSEMQKRLVKFLDAMDSDDPGAVGKTAIITRTFDGLVRRLGELLALSAKMEGQISILRVRAWAANLMRIIREESKDDELCRRIAKRLSNSVI